LTGPGWLLLATAVAAIYAVLALQVARPRIRGSVGPESVGDAFALLAAEIRRSVPSIPPGFTWKEAIMEARRMGPAVDWHRVDEAVRAYEGYRYGWDVEPKGGFEEIGRLARELRRAK
jgi:hypothetical protein